MRIDIFKKETAFFTNERLLAFNLALAIILSAISLTMVFSSEPPVDLFDQARKAVAKARTHQAAVYAPDLLNEAELNLNLAYLTWARENRRWMINREFFLSRQYCIKAERMAELATRRAIAVRDSLRWVAQTGIQLLKEQIELVRPQLSEMPIHGNLYQRLAMGELLMLESEEAFRRQDYRRAAACCQVAMAKIGNAGDEVKTALKSYFADTYKWRMWVEETLNWSALNNDIALVVDKLAHRCYVFESGLKKAEYPIEMGPHWLGHKRQRGDGATPEGRYYIRKKKSGKQTVYYKALEIDYPNAEDEARFALDRQRGVLSSQAEIGGLIEIHGDGGKGADWTAGCIALRNRDIDVLFDQVRIGTPITIVGSLRGIPLTATVASASMLSAQ